MVYILAQYYLINNSKNYKIDKKDKQISGEIYTADW